MIPYGAGIPGVQGLLPHRPIDAASNPSEDQVLGFLEYVGGLVAATLGDLEVFADPKVHERLEAFARGLVHMGGAALTELAGAPEQAGSEVTSYGQWLWARFEAGLELLNTQVELAGAAADVDPGEAAVVEPAWDFPPPIGWAQVRW